MVKLDSMSDSKSKKKVFALRLEIFPHWPRWNEDRISTSAQKFSFEMGTTSIATM